MQKIFLSFLFILFFIPGTPKDLLTYVSGLTPVKLWQWLLLTTIARIPSKSDLSIVLRTYVSCLALFISAQSLSSAINNIPFSLRSLLVIILASPLKYLYRLRTYFNPTSFGTSFCNNYTTSPVKCQVEKYI